MSGHLDTLRPYDLVLTPVLALLGALLAGPGASLAQAALAAATGAAACVAALYAGDVLTRHEDATAKPYRPIPSGRLSVRVATACASAGSAVTLLLALAVNGRSLLFVALAAGASYAYGARLKGAGLWGDTANGFSGMACAVLAGACFSAPWPSPQALLVAVALGLQGTYSNLVLALDDVERDRLAGCGTLPVRHGTPAARRVLLALAVAVHALAAAVPVVTGLHAAPAFWVLAGVSAALSASGLRLLFGPLADVPGAIGRHLHERLVLPGAFVALTGRTGLAVALALLTTAVVAAVPRPMLQSPLAAVRAGR